MLQVRDLHAYYGKSHVLQGVDLDVSEGEVVCIVGRNGAGRSTLLKALMGAVQAEGTATFAGQPLLGRQSFEIARMGLGYVPEDRAIFPTLSVEQNLSLGAQARLKGAPRWQLQDCWDAFPRLQERAEAPAGALSGGEQQMLTICRSLMGSPSLILIDEPTEGLSPQMVQRVSELLRLIASRGIAIVLVEQKLTIALEVSQRLYVMGHGRMVFDGTPQAFAERADLRREWLEV